MGPEERQRQRHRPWIHGHRQDVYKRQEKDIAAAERDMEAVKENALLKEEIDEDDIARIVAKWTGIPVARMLEGEIQKLVQMPERLKDRVVGQDEAVRLVSNAILRNRAGLSDPNRPIGSFIFLGPTGVGKTELVRALAQYMFDDDKAMILSLIHI